MFYSVSSELYREVAQRLSEAIGCGGYYSGTLVFAWGEAECRLTASVIVCRQRVSQPEGEIEPIVRLIPVWWEFHTLIDGVEQLNDFSFDELGAWL